MISKYLTIPPDEEVGRQRELLNLLKRIKKPGQAEYHDPNAWFFPPKNINTWEATTVDEPCVHGYLGAAPIMIVGSEPSTHRDFNGLQAKSYYQILNKYGLGRAHLTDCIKTDPDGIPDQRVQYNIFAEELRIVGPLFVLAFNDAATRLDGYLHRFRTVSCPRPMPHYTLLRYTSKAAWWEHELVDRLNAMRAWAEVMLVFDEDQRRYRLKKPSVAAEGK